MARNTVGSKYESVKNLSRVQIAKLIRQDIKSAIAKHELPTIKFSLRVTGHNALTLHVTEMSEGILLYNPEYLEAEYVTNDTQWIYRNREPGRYTTRAKAILDTIESIMEAYNFDKSEIETDYFHVNFYGSVNFDSDLTEARKALEMEPQAFARNLKIVRDQREAAFVKREQERLAQQAREAQESARLAAEIRANAAAENTQVLRALNIVQPRESIAQAAERVQAQVVREELIQVADRVTRQNQERSNLEGFIRTWISRHTANVNLQRVRVGVTLLFACLACGQLGRVNGRICQHCAGDRETTNAQNQRFIDAKRAELEALPPIIAVPTVPPMPTRQPVPTPGTRDPLAQQELARRDALNAQAKVEATQNQPDDEGPHAYIGQRFANLEID